MLASCAQPHGSRLTASGHTIFVSAQKSCFRSGRKSCLLPARSRTAHGSRAVIIITSVIFRYFLEFCFWFLLLAPARQYLSVQGTRKQRNTKGQVMPDTTILPAINCKCAYIRAYVKMLGREHIAKIANHADSLDWSDCTVSEFRRRYGTICADELIMPVA